MRALHTLAALAPLLSAAPSAASPAISSSAVFRHPARYLGREVRLCGYLIGPANITLHRRNQNLGLSVRGGNQARRLARLGGYAHVCLTGRIARAGCATDPNFICTDWAFDYAIDVREVG